MRILRLDGIRGIAILLVFARHSFSLPMGWVGVDIFFVLSGFLITGILRKDRGETHYWRSFYTRRITRILPPLIIAILAAALLFPIPWARVGWYYVFLLGNIPNVLGLEIDSLAVLWSLAVEEHFYLLWPLFVRRLERSQLIKLLVLLLILEPVARLVCTPLFSTFSPIYYLTPFRLDGLAAGSLLAVLLEEQIWRDRLKARAQQLCLAATTILALAMVFPALQREANGYFFNSVGYSLLAGASFFFVAFVILDEESPISKALSHRYITWIGLVSYGFYLYHPVFIFWIHRWGAKNHLHHLSFLTPLYFLLACGASWLSYMFYEKPILGWGRKWSKGLKTAVEAVPQSHVTKSEVILGAPL